MSANGDTRRLSGNPPLPYDRQQPGPYPEHPLTTPPGPPPAYPYYDRFGPEEPPAPPFREGFANEYNPKYWRTDREYPPNTPSPERYRPTPAEGWPRPPAWQEPEPVAWPDRSARDAFNPLWTRPPRETPSTRMFEPSATWKQIHKGPPSFSDSVPPRERPMERFAGLPVRDFRDRPVDRPWPREVYSPSQPGGERFPPFSPPAPPGSAPRNRFPYGNPHSDNYRPPHPEPEWAPEDDDLYADRGEGSSRDPPPPFSARSASQDRVDRRLMSRDNVERSVSPVSPRPVQNPSPGYGAAGTSMPKRESPELPHLVPLPPKPPHSEPVRIPLGPEPTPLLPAKPVSRSPSHSSHSSTASSSHPPHVSYQPPLRGSLPKAQQKQAHPGPSVLDNRPPARSQTGSPELLISPVAQGSAAVDNSGSVRRDQPPAARATVTTPQAQLPREAPQSSVNAGSQPAPTTQLKNAWNKGRLSYIQRAPSFVPSTLAIDAKLKYPERDVTANVVSQNTETGVSSSSPPDHSSAPSASDKRKDEMESDMEMSVPASPVKGLREREDVHMKEAEEARVTSDDGEEAADSSDMDMSPPASPVQKPAPISAPTSATPPPASSPPAEDANDEKAEPARPALTINTTVAPQLTCRTSRKRPPPSSTASTPNPRGDESDMEMSSPASSAAPSPASSPVLAAQSAPKPPSPHSSPAPPPSDAAHADIPDLSLVPTADPPRPQTPAHRDAAVSPMLQFASLATPRPTTGPIGKDAPSRDGVENRGQDIGTATPRSQRTAAFVERQHVASGELSPPVSEETLREETEGVEKDPDTVMHSEKERPAAQEKQVAPPADQGVAQADKILTDIPLADALRMVVRLRMMFPHQTQEERVAPVILSNRHIAEPEEPEQPQPEAVVAAVAEKEQEQASRGEYDGTKHSLRKRFAEHKAALTAKVDRLRQEYMSLHEKWMVHCAKLDEIARASALEEAAATAGRTTRRSAAMGDAVRTDLEMEQILASLGNEELTDANHLSAKNAAVIPDMLSVTKGRVDPVFDDTNNLVEDPHTFYALETGIDDWTDEEKVVFVEKYVKHPKQFGIIAGYLPNKTPAQCVTFYYLHKNTTIDFRKILAQFNTVGKRTRRGRGSKQKGNALLADILKHDDEVSRNATPSTTSAKRRRGQPPSTPVGTTPVAESEPGPSTTPAPAAEPPKRSTISRRSTTQNTPAGTPTPDPEPVQPAPKRPRRRAVPTPKAVAAMGRDEAAAVSSAAAPAPAADDVAEEDARPAKRIRKSRKSKAAEVEVPPTPIPTEEPDAPAASAETKFIDQTEATARKKSGGGSGNWSEDDKALFMKLLAEHGEDFKRIAASMPNKTTIQVTSFYKANLSEMELAKVVTTAPQRSPTPPRLSPEPSPVVPPVVVPKVVIPASKPSKPTPKPDIPSRSNSVMSPPPMMPLMRPLAPSPSLSLAPPDTPGPSPSAMSEAIPARFRGPMGNGAHPSFAGFGGAPLEPSAFVRLTAPQASGANRSPGVMEFSNFAPQPWMSGAHSLVGHGPVGSVQQTPGPPATLETTEDLMRYLEHRTRLTAGQNNDSDFM